MVEVATARGRVAYGPVTAGRRCRRFSMPVSSTAATHRLGARPDRGDSVSQTPGAADFRAGRHHRSASRSTTTSRTAAIAGSRARSRCPARKSSRRSPPRDLRGRGGAGFPAGIKWKTTLSGFEAAQKYVVCNADEGDSGTFSDRMIMEGDPFVLIEGMTIAGIAVGATQGYIYLRSEYPHALRTAERGDRAARRRAATWATNVARQRQALRARSAARRRRLYLRRRDRDAREPRGQARDGALQAAAARDRRAVRPAHRRQQRRSRSPRCRSSSSDGGAFYKDYGMGRSRGTLPLQLAGNVKHPGLVEKAFGVTLRELSTTTAAAPRAGVRCARCRSAARWAPTCPTRMLDLPLDYEAFAGAGRYPRPRRHRGVRRHRRPGAAWRAMRWSSARSSRAANARRAASAPRAASK